MQEALYNRYLRPNASFYTLITGRRPKKGEYGVEVEVEGTNLPHNLPGWDEHQDGSLRGESTEYVFQQPYDYGTSITKLTELEKAFKDNKSKLDFSYRTSIHVHVNVSDLTLQHVANFITMYFILEDVLFDFAGRDRAGNLFCLRGSDAQALIQALIGAVRHGRPADYLNSDQIRYSALNPKALVQHGSLEIRSFRGTEDFDAVRQWVTILHQLRQAVDNFSDPHQVVFGLSAMGAEGFIRHIFSGDTAAAILKRPRLYERLMDGVRLIQDFAFCIPSWEYQGNVPEVEIRDANNVNDLLNGIIRQQAEQIRRQGMAIRLGAAPFVPAAQPIVALDDVLDDDDFEDNDLEEDEDF